MPAYVVIVKVGRDENGEKENVLTISVNNNLIQLIKHQIKFSKSFYDSYFEGDS